MTFRWEDWSNDLRAIAENAKEGIDLAEDHRERLSRYHLYVSRLAAFLGKLPDMSDAVSPLTDLRDELDLLVHHQRSDLLRPAAAPRALPTVSDKRLRMVAATCVRLFRKVGTAEKESRERVAKLVLERGFLGGKSKFGADELGNWVSKIESGELPGADQIDRLFNTLPSLRDASTSADATTLSREMLARVRMPPVTAAQAEKRRPIA